MPGEPKRNIVGLRLDDEQRSALALAARQEDRPAAELARRAVVAWLKERGLLGAPPPARARSRL